MIINKLLLTNYIKDEPNEIEKPRDLKDRFGKDGLHELEEIYGK
ncbi:hypothetical protein [Thalassobacillus sp. CUG 92003]|nr:hypothetical protein [Thalassobacillus sp. CUG 92003]